MRLYSLTLAHSEKPTYLLAHVTASRMGPSGWPPARWPDTVGSMSQERSSLVERVQPLLVANEASQVGQLLDEALAAGDEVGSVFGELLEWFTKHPDSWETAGHLRKLAQAGCDLSSATAQLQRLLSKPSRTLSVIASSCLTFAAVHRDEWNAVDQLLEHNSENARWGAARAVADSLARGAEPDPRVTDRVAKALIDSDQRMRTSALEALVASRKAGRVAVPSRVGLECLVEGLALNPDIAEYLYELVTHDGALGGDIADLLYERVSPETMKEHKMLSELCQLAAVGKLDGTCEICCGIDANETGGCESELPAVMQRLVPKEGEVRKCPICGNRYRYEWDDEAYFDFFAGPIGGYSVRRLPNVSQQTPRGELEDGIEHPSKSRQAEAAVALSEIYAAEASWTELAGLLSHRRPAVRKATVEVLEASLSRDMDLTPLLEPIEQRLGDDVDWVRHCASRLLSRFQIALGSIEEVRTLLRLEDRYVRWGVLRSLQDAADTGDLDLSPLLAELSSTLWNPEILVRQSGLQVYKTVLLKAGRRSDLIAEFRAAAKSGNPEVALDASEALDNLGVRYDLAETRDEPTAPAPATTRASSSLVSCGLCKGSLTIKSAWGKDSEERAGNPSSSATYECKGCGAVFFHGYEESFSGDEEWWNIRKDGEWVSLDEKDWPR